MPVLFAALQPWEQTLFSEAKLPELQLFMFYGLFQMKYSPADFAPPASIPAVRA
jgi:hypothetical protein